MSEQAKVERDGKVAVLVSPGYGAGWSTWASEHKNWALFAPSVVAWVEGGKVGGYEAVEEIVKRELGADSYFYTGGAQDLVIEWLPKGTAFQVTEYDGSESLDTNGSIEWSFA